MGVQTIEEAMRQLDMEHYDDSDDEAAPLSRVLGGNTVGDLLLLSAICTHTTHTLHTHTLHTHAHYTHTYYAHTSYTHTPSTHIQSAMYDNEDDDPYITLPGAIDSDEEDLEIHDSDLLILAAKNEDDVSHLEVCVLVYVVCVCVCM